MTRLRSGSATDIGRNPRRTLNQDMILESNAIFAVADGMGGHQGGEVASLIAIEALRRAFSPEGGAEGLVRAIASANDAVISESESTPDLHDMGTTLAAVALIDGENEELLAVANIGDSRVYLFRDNELTQLTDDHSFPQELVRRGLLSKAEAAVDPRRNQVTRVLGPSFGAGPDIQNLIPYVGDRVLICSDGLYNEVDDDSIASALRTITDPTEAARLLVDQANANGGGDNISVVIVDVMDDDGRAEAASALLADDEPARPPRERSSMSGLMTADQRNAELRRLSHDDAGGRTGASADASAGASTSSWESGREPDVHDMPNRRITGRVIAFLVVLVLVLAGAAAAIGLYARGAYFVGLDEDERVAIFKGRPGGLLWFGPTVEDRTSLTADDVPAARADDVANGRPFADLEDARSYIRNLVAAANRPASDPATGTPTPTTEPTPAPPPTSTPTP